MWSRDKPSTASANWTADLGACVSPTKTKGGAQPRLPAHWTTIIGWFVVQQKCLRGVLPIYQEPLKEKMIPIKTIRASSGSFITSLLSEKSWQTATSTWAHCGHSQCQPLPPQSPPPHFPVCLTAGNDHWTHGKVKELFPEKGTSMFCTSFFLLPATNAMPAL